MKTNYAFFLLILMSVLALSGCSASSKLSSGPAVSGTEYYNSLYVGQSHAQIVKDFGAPNREVSDGEGGYILVYEWFDYSTRYDGSFIHNNVHRTYIEFYMDDSGLCHNVRTNKLSPKEKKEILTAVGLCFGATSALSVVGSIAILILMAQF